MEEIQFHYINPHSQTTESSPKRLSDARKSRQAVDLLSEQLHNRIQFLQREEENVRKSVARARSKAVQIFAIKERVAKERAASSRFKEEEIYHEEAERQDNFQKRRSAMQKIEAVVRLVQVHKRNDAKAMKLMKLKQKARLQESQQVALLQQRARTRAIHQKSGDASLSLELLKQEKRTVVGGWRHCRFESEIGKRDKRLAEISILEEERLTLAQRLTQSKRDQDSVEYQ